MSQGSISGAGLQAPQHHAPVESAEQGQVNIDFPLTPDEVRFRFRAIDRLAAAGCASGLVGLASTVLGLAGLAGAAYICLEANAEPDNSIAAHNRRWLGYGFGGGMGFVSSVAVTFGLTQVCQSLQKRRAAAQEIATLSTRVQFANTYAEDSRREPV
ncbi:MULTISPECIES: hypothetical protein [Pandoraea]|uniref:Transmembrane protein n=1 Tax=Pandoraea communis TaxID=2508297 RepID=A0A5E4RLF9_9BURK|nr:MULTISPECIES: hypothetical protein [Pandoraea]EON14744.1 hypothetical protein C266_06489 [Pandoraea sp. SD6-2]VVD63354.1 hypothetical protein PCO31110_00221 [Pandoraea communis]